MSKVRHFLVKLWLEVVEQYPCQIRFQAFCTGDVKCKTDRRQMLHWGGGSPCVLYPGAESKAANVGSPGGDFKGAAPPSRSGEDPAGPPVRGQLRRRAPVGKKKST